MGPIDVITKTTRFKALKLQKAGKLEILSPVQTMLQFIYNVSMGIAFTLIQWSSISFLFLLYIA